MNLNYIYKYYYVFLYLFLLLICIFIYILYIQNLVLCDDGGLFIYDLKEKLLKELDKWNYYKFTIETYEDLQAKMINPDGKIHDSFSYNNITDWIKEAQDKKDYHYNKCKNLNIHIIRLEPQFNMNSFYRVYRHENI